MAIAFLEEALLAEITLPTGEYLHYTPESLQLSEHMVLDGQALQHLEVIEAANGSREGSLLHFIDHCKTAFGRR